MHRIGQAARLASRGDFPEFLSLCHEISNTCGNNPDTILSVGALLQAYGYLSLATSCYQRIPGDWRVLANLANIAREQGNHRESTRIYTFLAEKFPNNPVIRRNLLVSLEYDPDISGKERLDQTEKWGKWVMAQAKGKVCNRPWNQEPQRIGYVSADFCQHTVGLFVKEIIKAHRIKTYAYSAGKVKDHVTEEISGHCAFRDVSGLGDRELADQISRDNIDVLVDLSGHTAGSRLAAFAHNPAPVRISWLGYFATTGLPVMDAVLLDKWHAPDGIEKQFVEKMVRLPGGKFCYTPALFAPDVADPPCLKNDYVTFGSFNNTAKYHREVFHLWNRVLDAVPNSKLILKWRTFQDDKMRDLVKSAFDHPERVELRGASFHKAMLKEYADMDIALDPFPFTGGLTSCEALWMGVPVVTWPQNRAVSRQTFAFLSAIGIPWLAAADSQDYIRIASELAGKPDLLLKLRHSMRKKMRISSLMNIEKFTRELESAYRKIYRNSRDRNNASL